MINVILVKFDRLYVMAQIVYNKSKASFVIIKEKVDNVDKAT